MATVLVFVEQHAGVFTGSSLGVLGKGKELAGTLGGDVVAVVAGSGITDLAATLGAYGVGRVLVADGDAWSKPVAGPFVDALASAVAATDATFVMAGASLLGAEIAGGLAGRLGIGITTDAVDVRADGGSIVVVRPALDDSVYVECGFANSGTCLGIGLFRANSFQPQAANGGQAQVEQLDVAGAGRPVVTHHGVQEMETGGVDITKADVLVGAGRGLGKAENFGLVEGLAKTLGGEVATTRPVVDAGWYGYSTQVGQTGKTVAPKLYVAVGISGAIQHKVGMAGSDVIVAINKDPNAPIFDYADFGVVGDLFDIVPKLEAELKSRKGS